MLDTVVFVVGILFGFLVLSTLPKPGDVWRRFQCRRRSTGKSVGSRWYIWPLGHLAWALQDFEGEASANLKTYQKDGAYFFWAMNLPMLQLIRPDWLKELLGASDKLYKRDLSFVPFFQRMLGDSIFAMSGDDWTRHHRILSRAFAPKKLEGFINVYQSSTQQYMELLKKAAKDGSEVDFFKMMNQLTLEVTATSLFGSLLTSDEKSELCDSLRYLLKECQNPIHGFSFLRALPFPSIRMANQHFARVHALVDRLIVQRRAFLAQQTAAEESSGEEKTEYFIDLILKAKDAEEGLQFSDREVRDTLLSFFVAGSETTAATMTWFIHHMCWNPEVYAKAVEEVDNADVKWDNFDREDLKKFPYVACCIDETLRVNPSIPGVVERSVQVDTVFGDDLFVPAGTRVNANSWICHHNPDQWVDPFTFNPDRFAPEVAKARHTYAYFPFGIGRRFCMGKQFALNEMLTTLPMLLRNFTFTTTLGKQKILMNYPTMQPKEGFRVKVALRNKD